MTVAKMVVDEKLKIIFFSFLLEVKKKQEQIIRIMFKQKFDFPTIEIGFTQNPSLLPVWILVVVLYLRFRNIAHFKAFFVFERASAISLKVWWIAIFQISPKQSLALLQQKKNQLHCFFQSHKCTSAMYERLLFPLLCFVVVYFGNCKISLLV